MQCFVKFLYPMSERKLDIGLLHKILWIKITKHIKFHMPEMLSSLTYTEICQGKGKIRPTFTIF